MSSERGGANQQINMQTFYPTNIAPQPSAKAGTFGTVWGYVEALFAGTRNSENDIVADDGVQNMNIVSDTLFVVAGCYYEHDYWQEYDSSDSNQAEPDPAQKLCTMPTHQFKMALRTKSGSTGKRIQQCTADELQAVGFWIETLHRQSGNQRPRGIAPYRGAGQLHRGEDGHDLLPRGSRRGEDTDPRARRVGILSLE